MTLEVLNSVKRKVTFNIKKQDVDNSSKEELKKYAKNAKLDGFRKGKVPANMVQQMYGGVAFEDSLNNHINKSFAKILIDNKLNLVGEPQFDLDNKDDINAEEFIFSAVFEVIPEITIGELSAQEVTQLECDIGDEEVSNTIEALRNQKLTYADCDTSAQNDNLVTIDFTGSVDGELFEGGSATDYQFVLGQGRMLADFEQGIQEMKIDETKDINVQFPEDYNEESLRGKNAVFKITLKAVQESILPELTPEFIKQLGIYSGDIDELKTEIAKNLRLEVNRRIKSKLKESALDALNKSTQIEVPDTLVHDEIHNMMNNAKNNMKKYGYKESEMKFTHEMFEVEAKKIVTYRLLVQQFMKDNNITVDDAEIRLVVEELAEMYDDKDDYIAWYYKDKKNIEESRLIALENKVINLIVSKTKVNTNKVSYTELIQLTNYK
jgi:trigger factor